MSRKMKDSGIEWIGEIPEYWEVVRLKQLLSERNESNNPLKTEFILSLTNDRGVIPYSEKGAIGNKSKEDLTGYKLAYPNDIVLNSMNVIIGSVGLSKYFGAVSPVYYMLYPRNKQHDVRFYNYIFQSKVFQDSLKGYGNGIMEIRMRIQMSKLNTVMLPLINDREQKKIANYLDVRCYLIDQTIEKQKQVIEKLKEYKQSVITEAVTKGLDPNVPMKDSGIEWIGEIPEHWDVVKLGIISNVQTGPFGSQLHSEDYVEVGTPIITVEHFGDGVINHTNLPFVSSEDVDRLSKYVLLKGDLVFSRVGSVDRCVLVSNKEEGWLFSGRCLRVRFITDILSEFILICFNKKKFKDYMNLIAVGSTMPSINTGILNNIRVPLPPINEQKKILDQIVKKTSKLNLIIDSKEQVINKLESYKKSLIYECVTGKREVK